MRFVKSNPQSDDDDDDDDEKSTDLDVETNAVTRSERNKPLLLLVVLDPGGSRLHLLFEFLSSSALYETLQFMGSSGWQNFVDSCAQLSSPRLSSSSEWPEHLIPINDAPTEIDPAIADTFLGKDDKDVLVVFPFNIQTSPEALDLVVKDAISIADFIQNVSQETDPTPPPGSQVTVLAEDLKRLLPKTYLNDNLIDFWHQWLVS